MPAFFSHYRFGFHSYRELQMSFVKEAIVKHPHAFVLGCQGPDLFFYHIGNYNGNERDFAGRLHEENTATFLNSLFEKAYMRNDNNSERTQIEIAYATGFLAHYCLDSKAHPYIYSMVGTTKGNYYTGKHFALESDIDLRLLRKLDNSRPSDYDVENIVKLSKSEREVVAVLLSYAVTRSLYGAHLSVEKSKFILKEIEMAMALMKDKSGNKGKYAKIIEKKFLGYYLGSSLLYNDLSSGIKDCCNEEHMVWLNPFTDFLSTKSFFDLFDEAKEEYLFMLNMLVKVFEKERSYAEFSRLIGNRSYKTGLEL